MESAAERSEQRRVEAQQCVERARQLQLDDRLEDAQAEVTNAWFALEDALALCPSNLRARVLLVSCAMNADDFHRARAEALAIYEAMSDSQLLSLGDSLVHLSIAHASKMLGNYDEAIKFSSAATQMFPEDPQAYMVLGELYGQLGEEALAEQKCRQALMYHDEPSCRQQLNGRNIYFTLCCLGSALVAQEKYSEAEMFLLKALQVDDADQPPTLALQHLVDVYEQQQRPDEALRAGRRAMELDATLEADLGPRLRRLEQGHVSPKRERPQQAQSTAPAGLLLQELEPRQQRDRDEAFDRLGPTTKADVWDSPRTRRPIREDECDVGFCCMER